MIGSLVALLSPGGLGPLAGLSHIASAARVVARRLVLAAPEPAGSV